MEISLELYRAMLYGLGKPNIVAHISQKFVLKNAGSKHSSICFSLAEELLGKEHDSQKVQPVFMAEAHGRSIDLPAVLDQSAVRVGSSPVR